MSSMLKPPIHWHYAGKLRQLLLDEACRGFTDGVIGALRDAGKPTVLLAPVPLTSALAEATKRSFERAGMAVYAMTEQQAREHSLSTAYDAAEAELRLAVLVTELSPGNDTAGADHAPATIAPAALPHRPWWRLCGLRASRQSPTAEPGRRPSGASPPTFVKLKRQLRSMGANAMIVCPPSQHRIGSPEDLDRSFELVSVLESMRQGDPTVRALPIPGLDRGELLQLVATLPSQILDGSSEHEMQLEREIERAATSAPEGFLIQALWRALKRGYGPDRFSLTEFDRRLASLDPELADAHPWRSLFDFWGEILRGLDSDREYSRRWLDKIEAHRDGLVSLEDIDDILLYESSIYALHCEDNRNTLSYPVVYHGTRWVQTRMALAAAFGGGQSSAQPFGGLIWDQ
jgi:hypothetical protein